MVEPLLPPDDIFPGTEWIEGTKPGNLSLNSHQFFEDAAGNWYLSRLARPVEDLTEVQPADLYNNTKYRYTNSLLGPGLYFGNHLPAVRITYLPTGREKPSQLYVVRFRPQETEIFDATTPLRQVEFGSMAAKLLIRSVVATGGFVLPPSRRMYDHMFSDSSAVISKPSITHKRGRKMSHSNDMIDPRWIAVRDLPKLDVVGRISRTNS